MDYFDKFSAAEPHLSQKIWEILEQGRQPNLYGKGQLVYQQGELAEQFYYLKSGRVNIFLSSENGDEKTLSILEAGNIFGEASFFDGLPRMSSAKTIVKSSIFPVNRAILMKCFREKPELAMHLLQYLAKTVRMLSTQLNHMTFLQADQRLAQILLRMSGPSRKILCTQEDLGRMAGLSRVTVSRTLNDFVRRGWISTGYRSLFLRDIAGLSSFAFPEDEILSYF